MNKPKILAFAGSHRKESLNKKLAFAAAEMARDAGAEVTFVDLKDYPMPLYDGDYEDENGVPDTTKQLFDLMLAHDGLLIACPEYNSSITPLLKNTIDWLSRLRHDGKPLAAFAGKTAALLSASPGALGGLRGLVHVRSILGNIQVHVIPQQNALGNANDAFADDGSISDTSAKARVESVVTTLVETTKKLNS